MGWLNAFMNTLKVVNVVFQDILNRKRCFQVTGGSGAKTITCINIERELWLWSYKPCFLGWTRKRDSIVNKRWRHVWGWRWGRGRSRWPGIRRLGVGSQVSHCFSPISGYTCPTVPLEKNWDNMHENTQNVSILYSTELGVVLLEIFHKISPGASAWCNSKGSTLSFSQF